MKLTILVENNSRIDNYLLSEPALSILIETNNKKILFDSAYSNIFIENAKKLNVDLNSITDIVLSHGHNDHTGGLQFLNINNDVNLIAHPNIFDKKFENGISYGCPLTKSDLKQKYILNLSKEPFKLEDDLIFLGEIKNNFSLDIDDSALVKVAKDGLFIVTGCSHSGIINIINYAKKVTKTDKIYGILGGFHLIDKDEDEIIEIAKYLRNENIKYIAPCHCCNLKSKIILSKYLEIEEICTGDIIVI